jgi:hypothetical protein
VKINKKMTREEVYLIDTSNMGFRCNIPAKIIGIEMCTPTGLPPRLCYHLRWSDSVEDFKPLYEKDYKIVTFAELLKDKYKVL